MNVMASKQLLRNYWCCCVGLSRSCSALRPWPGPTLIFFIYLFASFAVIDGIIAAVAALQERQAQPNWWLRLVGGIVGIILGLVLFFWPAETLFILFYLIAAWAIVTGVVTVISAFSGCVAKTRREHDGQKAPRSCSAQAATPNRRAMKETCRLMSPLPTPLTCPLRIMFITCVALKRSLSRFHRKEAHPWLDEPFDARDGLARSSYSSI